ncbi:MAG: universal stress protein [Nannocystaceae bacterium]
MIKWILGLDIRGRCHGASAFARWWADQGGGDPQRSKPEFLGLHVHRDPDFPPPGRYEAYDQLLLTARKRADEGLRGSAAHLPWMQIKWMDGRSPATALFDEAEREEAQGLIVGRKSRRGEVGLVRLGSVARHLVRELRRPTIVVPRDWAAKDAGEGPVLLATDLRDDAAAAATFAKQLAGAFGRPVVAVHVLRGMDRYLQSSTEAAPLRQQILQDGRDDALRWLKAHGLDDANVRVLPGDPMERVLTTVEELNPVMLVCGSRQLSSARRLVTTSLGSTLSAAAPCPVALVPPA